MNISPHFMTKVQTATTILTGKLLRFLRLESLHTPRQRTHPHQQLSFQKALIQSIMASETNPETNPPVEPQAEPTATAAPVTWEGTIKDYFLPSDVDCMLNAGGFDLSNKDDVADNATKIYVRVKNKSMPKQMPPWTQQNPDPAHPLWTDEMCANFKTWMDNEFP
ncbi:uncharacterized protein QC761_116458 [Podospora bellae-mahoneyi]|uniref:Uncharacterized protein n=1 Tax=Podospora bellae-mahoneyi TaxID=2093777 RepID=A0ABR0G0E0_9PEZI|nr:hypothetical protein QC761_116458 [Podospora bellae-mahoneyi]